jgi:hypothetical protein
MHGFLIPAKVFTYWWTFLDLAFLVVAKFYEIRAVFF